MYRYMKWRRSIMVRCIYICPELDHCSDNIRAPCLCCNMQSARCLAINSRTIRIGTKNDGDENLVPFPFSDCIGKQ